MTTDWTSFVEKLARYGIRIKTQELSTLLNLIIYSAFDIITKKEPVVKDLC